MDVEQTKFLMESNAPNILKQAFLDNDKNVIAAERLRFKPLVDAVQEFIDRCDRHEIRSVETYNKFKELLKQLQETK
jgi:hypothetical protein